jgi:hypothetical protein
LFVHFPVPIVGVGWAPLFVPTVSRTLLPRRTSCTRWAEKTPAHPTAGHPLSWLCLLFQMDEMELVLVCAFSLTICDVGWAPLFVPTVSQSLVTTTNVVHPVGRKNICPPYGRPSHIQVLSIIPNGRDRACACLRILLAGCGVGWAPLFVPTVSRTLLPQQTSCTRWAEKTPARPTGAILFPGFVCYPGRMEWRLCLFVHFPVPIVGVGWAPLFVPTVSRTLLPSRTSCPRWAEKTPAHPTGAILFPGFVYYLKRMGWRLCLFECTRWTEKASALQRFMTTCPHSTNFVIFNFLNLQISLCNIHICARQWFCKITYT